MGCPVCGVVAVSHGRRTHEVVDTPCFGRPVRLRWRKRTWSCPEVSCPVGTFTEQDEDLAAPRAKVSTRATWWAVRQLRREHASVAGLARQLGITWRTLWAWIRPLLAAMAADQDRFAGVHTLGVDEHIWHHVSTKERGPKWSYELLSRPVDWRVTRCVDHLLIRGCSGRVVRPGCPSRTARRPGRGRPGGGRSRPASGLGRTRSA
ncbi:MAG: transposase family protein [Actinomycetota bacterium]|nr:transposase family protein [Actinomycetota bacterium]MDQ3527490.1 transposase family protein [Actinomycetota bacterium]